MTAPTITETTPELSEQHEGPHYAHYVDQSRIVDASVMGFPLLTLCGIKLVPSRNTDKLPICTPCKEIFDNINSFMGD